MARYDTDAIDLGRFKQMYLTVASVIMVLPSLTFVLWFTMRDARPMNAAQLPAAILPVFAVVALASIPLALVVRSVILRQVGDFTAQRSTPSAPQRLTGEDAAIGRITSAAMVGMALPEVSLILGFVLGFMTGSWLYFIPFAAYAVLGWAIMFPRPAQVRAWYQRQMGVAPVPTIIS